MPNKLDIFDFDGTLFNSPSDTPKNREKYERATGLPWIIDKEASRRLSKEHGRHIGMRRGWWGRPETLEPPLVPDPAPQEWFIKDVCDKFLVSKANPETITLIMTGRFVGLRHHVLRILGQGKLVVVQMKKSPKDGQIYTVMADEDCALLCLGDKLGHTGSVPAETFPWKVWIIERYLEMVPEINTVEIWEDRDKHVEKFQELHGTLVETVIVNHVKA